VDAVAITPMTLDDYDQVASLWQQTEGVSGADSRAGVAAYLHDEPRRPGRPGGKAPWVITWSRFAFLVDRLPAPPHVRSWPRAFWSCESGGGRLEASGPESVLVI
jgi:hypothetical protein